MPSKGQIMKSDQSRGTLASLLSWTIFSLVSGSVSWSGLDLAKAASNVVLWDTASPLANPDNIGDRTRWKLVPTDLLSLEADPPKASSDPGYYGREYTFKGDAVVENERLVAVFSSAQGKVVIFSKPSRIDSGTSATGKPSPGRKALEFAPSSSQVSSPNPSRCTLLRNGGDEVALDVSFSAPSSGGPSARFSFDKTEIIAIKPSATIKEFRLSGAIEYGVVPSFIGDDLVFGAAEYPSAEAVHLPSENLFLGLMKGESQVVVLTWPAGHQRLRLAPGPEPASPGKRLFAAVDFVNDGKNLYLAVLETAGLWHREELKASFLEKDVAIAWKRPFPAKWTSQLLEAGVKTTFAFRESKGQIWRGVPGSYSYPVWFDGETAYYRLSKKVLPKGESIVYFREGDGTPGSISTPVDILKATLGRDTSEAMLDLPGRKLRTHHRRDGEGVRRSCTCGCTEVIQAIFEAGEEVEQKPHIVAALDDMVYFVERHVERIDEYQHFAEGTLQLLRATRSSHPELQPFLDRLEPIAQQIPQEYEVQKGNMKSLQHAQDLVGQTLALTAKKDARNRAAYLELFKAWRAMGGAQDYVLAQCHTLARKLFQEAGYASARQAGALEVGAEVRQRCRQCLRNPDGYEIWANY